MLQDHRTREETRQLILQNLITYGKPMTRTEIARALNRRKTPHLTAMIDELVHEGYLTRQVISLNNGLQAYVYGLGQW